MKRSGPIPRRTPLARSARVKARNPKRRQAEFARAYGSDARVAFVQALPCCVCGQRPSENAHVGRQAGMGRKGDAQTIAPLCHSHHHEQHTMGVQSFAARYGVDLEAAARHTETLWQQEQAAA